MGKIIAARAGVGVSVGAGAVAAHAGGTPAAGHIVAPGNPVSFLERLTGRVRLDVGAQFADRAHKLVAADLRPLFRSAQTAEVSLVDVEVGAAYGARG